MRRQKNLFAKLIEFGNLRLAFLGASRGKRDRSEVQRFEYHLESELWQIRRELESEAYDWGAYRRFWITDPKRREIRAAPFRDRVVHHALFNVIDPALRRGFIADTYACLPGRGVHAAVRRFESFVRARRGQGYVLKCDIKKFFNSIDHRLLITALERRIGDERLLRLLASLIGHGGEIDGKGIPIGNLTSQLFANLYLDSFDHHVKEGRRVRHYLRYMDDFVLLAADSHEAKSHLSDVRMFLDQRLSLELNQRCTIVAPLEQACDLLGYVRHYDGRWRVRKRSVLRLWRRLPALARSMEAGAVTYAEARSSIASWFGLAKHGDAFRVSASIFGRRDVRNIGKRLLVQQVAMNMGRMDY